MTISPSMCCFSVETSLSTSPLRTAELFQAGLARSRTRRTWAVCPLARRCEMATARRATRSFAGPAGGPRRPAPRRARAWQAAGYFRSGRPSRGLEAFVAGRVLDDSVERDVLAHDDLSHFGSAPRWSSGTQTLAARPASLPCLEEQPVSFAGPPGVILDGFHEVFVDGHGLLLLLIGAVSSARPIPASTAQARKADWWPSVSAASGFAPLCAAR